MPKSDRQHRNEISRHIRATFELIVKKHEAGEAASAGDVGFLIALIENLLIP